MTEKRYKMINTNLADENGRIYYNIQREDGFNICQVYGKYTAKSLIDELNELSDENEQLKQFKEKVFSLIDKEITRNEEIIEVFIKPFGFDSGSRGFYNHMLKRLQKELEE